jgi:hypothetical protein
MKLHLIAAAAAATTLLAFAVPAAAEAPRVVVRGFESHEPSMSLHLTGTGLTLGEDAIDPEGAANLGGVGLSWRWDLVDWGGLEIGFSTVGRRSEGGLVNDTRGIFSASWLWYFARHHNHRFYGVTGLVGMGTELDIGANRYSYGEGGFVLGVGSEWMLGKDWMVSVDARALFLSADQENPVEADVAPAPGDGRARQPYPVEWWNPPAERTGAQFNVGIGYRW